jgi:hypothetical protein
MGVLSRHVHARWESAHSLSTPDLRKSFLNWQGTFHHTYGCRMVHSCKRIHTLTFSRTLRASRTRIYVQHVSNAQCHHDVSAPHDWKLKILTKTIGIHRHNPVRLRLYRMRLPFSVPLFRNLYPKKQRMTYPRKQKLYAPKAKSQKKRSTNKNSGSGTKTYPDRSNSIYGLFRVGVRI